MDTTQVPVKSSKPYLPQSLSDVDIETSLYLEDLQTQLANSDLYMEYSKVVKKLRHMLHSSSIEFDNSPEQSFAKEVFYRVMEESVAYIADVCQGAFFAANHHIRALLELNAIVEYVLSPVGKDKKFLERFHLSPAWHFIKSFIGMMTLSSSYRKTSVKIFFLTIKN